MHVRLKPVKEQVIAITGATSGIGLTTARAAAERGARLALNGRNEEALRELEREITAGGGEAIAVAGDVANIEDLRRLSRAAVDRFGGFDTWINNAGVSIYGRLEEVSQEDHRRLFETNFWGVVNGSLVAVEHLRAGGGALVNMGSTVSDRAIPLQGMYSASKHAVKGFTDALRMELEHDGAPVSVTLIKPGAIDTPYIDHARNYMREHPEFPPPVYAPENVARAVLHAAEHPVRDLFVGSGGKMLSAAGNLLPRTTDRIMERTMFDAQRGDRPPHDEEALHRPGNGLQERGDHQGLVRSRSYYTEASMHPWVTGAVLLGAGLAVAGLVRAAGAGRDR